ncbi:MAG: DUF721 domain-containing protein [Sphaerochaeta sp.]|nr:DUF721 domain-containing protein [Sphaerochaeta sp.]MDX9915526.1 DUF721 domain-containing protein [Sphaerochaeta sp.]
MAKDRRERVCKEGEPMEGKEVLSLVLRRLKIDPNAPRSALGFSWQEIVGERLYPHVKIVDIKLHTLVLRADHPSWAQITMMQQKRIIAELQRRYPSLDITMIQVIT